MPRSVSPNTSQYLGENGKGACVSSFAWQEEDFTVDAGKQARGNCPHSASLEGPVLPVLWPPCLPQPEGPQAAGRPGLIQELRSCW